MSRETHSSCSGCSGRGGMTCFVNNRGRDSERRVGVNERLRCRVLVELTHPAKVVVLDAV